MIKKIMLASCLLVASMASQAALISYNGYERDTANNYVTGGGLEWLMWDVTKGKSINEAIAAHGANGWELASNKQVTSLFNTFQFGKDEWIDVENIFQTGFVNWGPDETGPFLSFLALFGNTYFQATSMTNNDHLIISTAFYGSDLDGDGRYQYATLRDDYADRWDRYAAVAHLESDWYAAEEKFTSVGVALVRKAKLVPPAQVSLPGSLSLLALGLVAFGVRRRQVSRR